MIKKGFVLLHILILCSFLTVHPLASLNEEIKHKDFNTYNTAKSLFNEALNYNESLTRQKEVYSVHAWNSYFETVEYEVDFITRYLKEKLSIKTDVVLADIVHIEVKEDAVLTVEEGATLVVLGDLKVQGTLINNGTIVLGKASYRTAFGTDTPAYHGNIDVIGSFANSGTTDISNGTLAINENGIVENMGTNNILNSQVDSRGIDIITKSLYEKEIGGTLVNSGTINVKNKAGKGIIVPPKSTLDNKGSIYKNETGNILGTVKGNQVVMIN